MSGGERDAGGGGAEDGYIVKTNPFRKKYIVYVVSFIRSFFFR